MRTQASHLTLIALLLTVFTLSACGPSKTSPTSETKRYQLKGRVVSLDKASQTATIDGENIPGFMSAMTMPYKVKNAAEFAQLAPGDSITAEIVAGPTNYWLENVHVTQHTKPSP